MSAELIECFNNTYKMALEDSRLKSDTSSSVKNTVVYKENYKARLVNRADFNAGIDVIVEETTSFVAARRYSGESKKGVINKVAVLNFANPHVPGGGVTRGAKAQEESLCRSSNLYPCLISKSVTKKYYEYNKAKDRFFSDRIIYSPSVVIFKDDGNVPHLMPESMWTKVDIITCAAPFLENPQSVPPATLRDVFVYRIRNIFEVAVDNEVNTLILGAFGCGAFNNPPQIVADAFKIVVDEYSAKMTPMRKIVFAIKRTVPDNEVCQNLGAFQRAFYGVSEEFNKLRFGGDLHVNLNDRKSKDLIDDNLSGTELLKEISNDTISADENNLNLPFDNETVYIYTSLSQFGLKQIMVCNEKKIGECVSIPDHELPVEIYFYNYKLRSLFASCIEISQGMKRDIRKNDADIYAMLIYIEKGIYRYTLDDEVIEVKFKDNNVTDFYFSDKLIAKIVRLNKSEQNSLIMDGNNPAIHNFTMYIDKRCGLIAKMLFSSFLQLRFDTERS